VEIQMRMAQRFILLGAFFFQLLGGGWLGILVQDLTPRLALRHGLLVKEGAFVARVEFNSPAKKGGLIAGDVITALNSQAVSDAKALQRVLSEIDPGARIRLDIIRGRRKEKVEILLGSLPGGSV